MDSINNNQIPIKFYCPQCELKKKMLIWRENCEFSSGICEDCWDKLYLDIENSIRRRLDENKLLISTERLNEFKNKLEKLTVNK